MLLGIDIIKPEGITMDFQKCVTSVRACQGMTYPLRITPRGQSVENHAISTAKDILVKLHTSQWISIRMRNSLSLNWDYHFNAFYNFSTSYLALHNVFPEAIIDDKTDSVIYHNMSDTLVKIQKNQKINIITDWDMNDCITKESSDVINLMFDFTKCIPSVLTCMKFNLTALQYV